MTLGMLIVEAAGAHRLPAIAVVIHIALWVVLLYLCPAGALVFAFIVPLAISGARWGRNTSHYVQCTIFRQVDLGEQSEWDYVFAWRCTRRVFWTPRG